MFLVFYSYNTIHQQGIWNRKITSLHCISFTNSVAALLQHSCSCSYLCTNTHTSSFLYHDTKARLLDPVNVCLTWLEVPYFIDFLWMFFACSLMDFYSNLTLLPMSLYFIEECKEYVDESRSRLGT